MMHISSGNEPGARLEVLHDGTESPTGEVTGWTTMAVLTTTYRNGRPRRRLYVLSPAESEDSVAVGSLYVRGLCTHVAFEGSTNRASKAWKRCQREGVAGARWYVLRPQEPLPEGWRLDVLPRLGITSDRELHRLHRAPLSTLRAYRESLEIAACPRGRPARPVKGSAKTIEEYERDYPGISDLAAGGASAGELGAYANKSRSWGGKVQRAWKESGI